jgi:hypothetical protein
MRHAPFHVLMAQMLQSITLVEYRGALQRSVNLQNPSGGRLGLCSLLAIYYNY